MRAANAGLTGWDGLCDIEADGDRLGRVLPAGQGTGATLLDALLAVREWVGPCK